MLDPFVDLLCSCRQGGANPCLDATYDDNESAVAAFARKEAHAFIGYSERLHPLLTRVAADDRILISGAPIGAKQRTILYVDVLTLRRDAMAAVQQAARSFATFLDSPETHDFIVMSRDAGSNAVPRYLLPAMKSAYERQALRADPYYPQLKKAIATATPFPNGGWYEVRRTMRDKIVAAERARPMH